MKIKKSAKPKVLVLFSGGLDSRLAVKMLQEQADVECINFILPFGAGCCNSHCSLNFCQQENCKLHVVDCTKGKLLEEYLNLVRKPKHGYGVGLNPCIDCRIFLLRKAKEFADKNKMDIIATGEVLGERPMSQHKSALEIVERESQLQGRLLRPLSAKFLPETEAEKKGIINRSKLLDIQGRGRGQQIALANKYNITFPSPGGGCLLCEKEFCNKLEPILNSKLEEMNIELIKIGRHFESSNIIVGRDAAENKKLEEIYNKHKKGMLIIPEQPGPNAFILDKKYFEQAKQLIQQYSKHKILKFEVS